MKKKGFTLIELLSVIVILAIIALIAVPTILNIINNAQKSAFKDSVYGIIKAGELYYTNKMMETSGMTEDKTFTFPDESEELEIKGSKLSGGIMIVTEEGRIGIAVSNGKYCIKKGYVSEELIVDENLNDCKIPSILTSQNTCVKDKNATCENGTLVTVQVNEDTSYDFYVINDTGSELTLIMDRNIGDKVAWYSSASTNTKGPLTALNYLETQTSGWTNVPVHTYILKDDNIPSGYEPISRERSRARMLTRTEAVSLGCNGSSGSCPSYLYANASTSNNSGQPPGYWFSTVNTANGFSAWKIYACAISSNSVHYKPNYGVRAVITLLKIM